MIVQDFASLAEFLPNKMGKTTVAAGDSLFVGLNSFEPGQEHTAHAHAGQDKLYVVLQGRAEVHIGADEAVISTGAGAFAPAGVVHAIRNPGPDRLIVLALLAPPPPPK